jgi:hypothetical protein
MKINKQYRNLADGGSVGRQGKAGPFEKLFHANIPGSTSPNDSGEDGKIKFFEEGVRCVKLGLKFFKI